MHIDEIKQKAIAEKWSKVKIAFSDIDGVLRGKIIGIDKFSSVLESSIGFCDVVFGWDSNDSCYDNVSFTGWHTAYPDMEGKIDTQTFRTIPWEDNMPFFLGDFSQHQADGICPRTLLKKVKKQAEELGMFPVFAQEFEWFNFKETSHSLADKHFQDIRPLTTGMFGYSVLRLSENSSYVNDLFDLLTAFRIPIEGIHTETGPGVYEATIIYDEVLSAADKAILFKSAVKEIAKKHGIAASFMAKWNKDLPGSGGHVHQSLWTKDRSKNLFYDTSKAHHMSDVFAHYVAGQLYCMPYILPMYAPVVNSYKRLVEGAWAPTKVTWGVDNRTTALRVISPDEKHTRLETRIPGADTNPYLVMAAALASGLYGIKHKLPLYIPPVTGNGYQVEDAITLAPNLYEATRLMQDSSVARELFGEAFVAHFTQTRFWEWRQFSKQVTDWELRRYLEII